MDILFLCSKWRGRWGWKGQNRSGELVKRKHNRRSDCMVKTEIQFGNFLHSNYSSCQHSYIFLKFEKISTTSLFLFPYKGNMFLASLSIANNRIVVAIFYGTVKRFLLKSSLKIDLLICFNDVFYSFSMFFKRLKDWKIGRLENKPQFYFCW
jgi:hypothetical protein